MARITSVSGEEGGLQVTLGEERKFLSWLWLRDHSQEPDAFHQKARQRLLETFRIGAVGPAERIEVAEGGDRLALHWRDGGVSRFTADYLAAIGAPDRIYDVLGADQVTWDASNAAEIRPTYAHEDFVGSDASLTRALQDLRRYGLITLKAVPTNIEASRKVMERIAYIRSSIFGEMWELKSDGKIADTGSTPLEISPHTDGTYNHDAPGLMSLHCLAYDATGGDNVLVDGFHIARLMQAESPELYQRLSTIAVPGQYIGDGAYLVAQRPVFRHDANGRLVQVSFNNHDRAPFTLPEPQMSQLYEALGAFDRLIQDRANQFAFGQRPGDMVIFDNWRLLHGRHAFTGQRHMVGSYLNREDFESRLRVLSQQPLDMVA
jgi:trimethyllysine dioxygenase